MGFRIASLAPRHFVDHGQEDGKQVSSLLVKQALVAWMQHADSDGSEAATITFGLAVDPEPRAKLARGQLGTT